MDVRALLSVGLIAIYLIAGSTSLALEVSVREDGAFSTVGPADQFVTWAVENGGRNQGFVTYRSPQTQDEWVSAPSVADSGAIIEIPFNFSTPIKTARIDYGAACHSYGSNPGFVKLWLDVNGTETLIFQGVADSSEPSFNYTLSETPPKPMGYWRGYTDISALVQGASSFVLKVQAQAGWSPWLYNGGTFLPAHWSGASDFLLTGTAEIFASQNGSDFRIIGPADSLSSWALDRSGRASQFSTNRSLDTGGRWMSGPLDGNARGTLSIPVTVPRRFDMVYIYFSAVCQSYNSYLNRNGGWVKLWVSVEGVDVLIFNGNSDVSEAPYNYTTSQTPPDPMNWWRGFADITNLVRGKRSFILKIECNAGASALLSNGGQFLPDYWTDSRDLVIAGSYQSGAIRGRVPAGISSIDLVLHQRGGAVYSFENVQVRDDKTFSVSDVPPGRYDLTASSLSLSSRAVSNILIVADATLDVGVLDPFLTGYEQWLFENDLPSDATGDGSRFADPLGDGVVNLLKYALGLGVTSPGTASSIRHGTVEFNSLSYLTLTYQQPDPVPSDLVYTSEVSPDLQQWSDDTVTIDSRTVDGLRFVTDRDTVPIGPDAPRRFMRLEIRQP